jgi:hypothetical protein
MYKMEESISLGWNCESASMGVALCIRNKKENGYNTCPFDECITNYNGIRLCIEEDFKHFCDIDYLKLIPAKFSTGEIIKDEILIYNTRYNFIFNHESPDHANLYITQNWVGGKNHYIDNNFSLFIERYTRRINNFRYYCNNYKITFIMGKFNNDYSELNEIIKKKYPTLAFNILSYIPSVQLTVFEEHHLLMKSI